MESLDLSPAVLKLSKAKIDKLKKTPYKQIKLEFGRTYGRESQLALVTCAENYT